MEESQKLEKRMKGLNRLSFEWGGVVQLRAEVIPGIGVSFYLLEREDKQIYFTFTTNDRHTQKYSQIVTELS